jgi:hypothetical protein
MALVNLTVDVTLAELDLTAYPLRLPFYRLYIDSELMCERCWRRKEWSCIRENIYINLEPNTPCHMVLDKGDNGRVKLKISNLNVLIHEFEILNSDSTSITFRIV